MKTLYLAFCFALLAENGSAQRHKLASIDAASPDGKLIQQSLQENDPAKKLAILEQFMVQHPNQQETTEWVLAQLQPMYVKAGSYDKALEIGEKLLAMDADDLDASYSNLKAAEGKQDVAAIMKWSGRTSQIARKLVSSPKPQGEDAEEWKVAVDYAKQVDTYTEYALYLAALRSTNPPQVILLTDTLEQQN